MQGKFEDFTENRASIIKHYLRAFFQRIKSSRRKCVALSSIQVTFRNNFLARFTCWEDGERGICCTHGEWDFGRHPYSVTLVQQTKRNETPTKNQTKRNETTPQCMLHTLHQFYFAIQWNPLTSTPLIRSPTGRNNMAVLTK